MLIRMDDERHALDDLQAIALQPRALRGIVRQETNGGKPEIGEDLCADAIVAEIRCKAELDVRLNGIAPLILQSVGTHLICKSDAASLLPYVEDNALTLCLDAAHCRCELIAAVTAHRAERIPRQALRVHAHENIFLAAHIPLDNGEVTAFVERVLVGDQFEMPILAREVHLRNPMDKVLRMFAVLDEILDGDDVQPMLFRKRLQLGRAHHVAVIRHDLTTEPRREQPCHTREVGRRLGVSRTAQDAPLNRTQGEYMARAAEIRGLCRRIEQHLDRVAPLVRRDARRRVVRIDADSEGSLVVVRVVLHHLTDLKLVEAAADDRRADQTACMCRHEVHVLRRHLLCRDDEVALVLPILIVHDDEHLSVFDILDCLFNRCKI